MAFRWHLLIGLSVFLLGIGGILFYDRYYVPVVLAQDVVKVKVSNDVDILARNYLLKRDDLYLDKVPTQHLPNDYISSIEEAENKILNTDVTHGTILTRTLIDVDDLQPKIGEGIFPIPKDAIFAINGSLRRRDVVDVYAIDIESETQDITKIPDRGKLLEHVVVAYVRSDDNNDVQDTDDGNLNHRITSTGRVSYPELILTDEQGLLLKNKIEQGFLLWIVRVE